MKNFLGFVGLVLIAGTLASGTDKFYALLDWSSGEVIGYNISTLVMLGLGGYLIYRAFKKTA